MKLYLFLSLDTQILIRNASHCLRWRWWCWWAWKLLTFFTAPKFHHVRRRRGSPSINPNERAVCGLSQMRDKLRWKLPNTFTFIMKLFNLLDITVYRGLLWNARDFYLWRWTAWRCDKHREDLQGTMTDSKWYFWCSFSVISEKRVELTKKMCHHSVEFRLLLNLWIKNNDLFFYIFHILRTTFFSISLLLVHGVCDCNHEEETVERQFQIAHHQRPKKNKISFSRKSESSAYRKKSLNFGRSSRYLVNSRFYAIRISTAIAKIVQNIHPVEV